MASSGGFDVGVGTFAPVGSMRQVAAEVKGHSIIADVEAAASGLEGTPLVEAIQDLAAKLGTAIVAYGDTIEGVADKLHSVDQTYQEKDDAIGETFKQMVL